MSMGRRKEHLWRLRSVIGGICSKTWGRRSKTILCGLAYACLTPPLGLVQQNRLKQRAMRQRDNVLSPRTQPLPPSKAKRRRDSCASGSCINGFTSYMKRG